MHSRGYKGFLVLWIGYYESQAKSTTAHVPEQAKQYVFMGTVSRQQTHGMKCLFVTKKNHTGLKQHKDANMTKQSYSVFLYLV